VEDEQQESRLEAVEAKKARGKGAPKKRTKEGAYLETDGSRARMFVLTNCDRIEEAYEEETEQAGGMSEIVGAFITSVQRHLHWIPALYCTIMVYVQRYHIRAFPKYIFTKTFDRNRRQLHSIDSEDHGSLLRSAICSCTYAHCRLWRNTRGQNKPDFLIPWQADFAVKRRLDCAPKAP
jgi:hypothetical protein